MMYKLTIPGRPTPKKRPRVTKSHTYNPSQDDEEKILELWCYEHGQIEIEGPLMMSYKFYMPDRRHGDLKNLIALVEDALGGKQGDGYKPFDDKQVKHIIAHMQFEFEGDARTEVVIQEMSG